MENLAKFFLKTTGPMHLADAPGGKDFQTPAHHHDSNQRRARSRHCNATRGHVWDNFSSENYKNSPSVRAIDVYNPFDGSASKFQMPAGGPGYYRVPTLISIWATAPFFHNNALGKYTGDPSVKGRVEAFNDAITKMLWPEKRDDKKSICVTQQKSYLRIPAVYLPEAFQATLDYRSRIILVYLWLLPLVLCIIGIALFIRGLRKKRGRVLRILGVASILLAAGLMMVSYFLAGEKGDLIIGPIPKGTPINLLSSINSEAERKDLLAVILKTGSALRKIEQDNLDDAAATALLKREVAPALLKVSNCPDFVEDRNKSQREARPT
jgi:hypothetical protein